MAYPSTINTQRRIDEATALYSEALSIMGGDSGVVKVLTKCRQICIDLLDGPDVVSCRNQMRLNLYMSLACDNATCRWYLVCALECYDRSLLSNSNTDNRFDRDFRATVQYQLEWLGSNPEGTSTTNWRDRDYYEAFTPAGTPMPDNKHLPLIDHSTDPLYLGTGQGKSVELQLSAHQGDKWTTQITPNKESTKQ